MGDYTNKNDKVPLENIDPVFIEGVAWAQFSGEEKHKDNHWTGGVSVSKIIGALKRHIAEIEKGEYVDSDSGLQHAYHAACGLMYIANYVRNNQRYNEFFDQQFGGPPEISDQMGQQSISREDLERRFDQVVRRDRGTFQGPE